MTLSPKKRRWIQIGIIVGFLALIVVFYLLRSVLWPFIFAFFIAYILNPWINFLQKKGFPRTLAILFVLIFFALLVTLGVWLIIPQASHEFADFAKNVPRYAQVVRSHAEPWVQGMMEKYPDLAPQIQHYYQTSLKPKLPGLVKPVLDFLATMFSGVVNFVVVLLNLALVPVLAFYMMSDFGSILAKGLELVPPDRREAVVT